MDPSPTSHPQGGFPQNSIFWLLPLVFISSAIIVFGPFKLDPDLHLNSNSWQYSATKILHYLEPIVLTTFFLITSLITLSNSDWRIILTKTKSSRRTIAASFALSIIITYVVDVVLSVLYQRHDPAVMLRDHQVAYNMGCIISWSIITLSLSDENKTSWYPYIGSWTISFIFETVLLILCFINKPLNTSFSIMSLIIASIRVILVLSSLGFLFFHYRKKYMETRRTTQTGLACDEIPFIGPAAIYGTIESAETEASQTMDDRELHMSMMHHEFWSWATFVKAFMVFIPYMWPQKNLDAQLAFLASIMLLVIEGIVLVLIPKQIGSITDEYDMQNRLDRDIYVPWTRILLLIGLSTVIFKPVLPTLRYKLWKIVDEHARKRISSKTYRNISMNPGLFTDQTAFQRQLVNSIDCSAINSFTHRVIHDLIPEILNTSIAFIFLYIEFGSRLAFVLACTSTALLRVSTIIAYREADTYIPVRKTYADEQIHSQQRYNARSHYYFFHLARSNDGGTSFKSDADGLYQRVLFYIETGIWVAGIVLACIYACYAIKDNYISMGDFIVILIYWPLVTKSFISVKTTLLRLLSILLHALHLLNQLKHEEDYRQTHDQPSFIITKGTIKLDSVTCFQKDEEHIQNIIFEASAGSTVAIVGSPKSGKRTVLRVLLKLCKSDGKLSIDGQDLSNVNANQLKSQIAVLHKDIIIFDDTIRNNLTYMNIDATDEMIEAACKVVSLHDSINMLPNGYSTNIYDHSVQWEHHHFQRVAIARAILQGCKIVVMEESDDVNCIDAGRQLQSAFRELAQGRTILMVAHRLSTVMAADQIVLVEQGKICESGSHDELFARKGKYYRLWSDHISSHASVREANTSLLVNDLSPSSRRKELVKRIKNVGQKRGDDLSNKVGGLVSGQLKYPIQEEGNTLYNNLSRESLHNPTKLPSKLKPEAAEYIPAALRQQHDPSLPSITHISGDAVVKQDQEPHVQAQTDTHDKSDEDMAKVTDEDPQIQHNEEVTGVEDDQPRRARARRHRTRSKRGKMSSAGEGKVLVLDQKDHADLSNIQPKEATETLLKPAQEGVVSLSENMPTVATHEVTNSKLGRNEVHEQLPVHNMKNVASTVHQPKKSQSQPSASVKRSVSIDPHIQRNDEEQHSTSVLTRSARYKSSHRRDRPHKQRVHVERTGSAPLPSTPINLVQKD